MADDQNVALVRRFIDEVFVAGSSDAVDRLVTGDFVPHGLQGSRPEVMRSAIARVAAGLSDVEMDVEDAFGAGDRVAVRLRSSVVQSGPLMRMPPTGGRYEIEEIHLFRIAGDRIAEHWHQADFLGMLGQLGLMPGPPGGA